MGGSTGTGGYAPPRKQARCETLTLDASINSPTSAISQLALGCVVALTPGNGAGSSVLVHYQGQLMGSLTGVKVSQLARCLACSGQQNPNTFLVNFSAFAGGSPSLNRCGRSQL